MKRILQCVSSVAVGSLLLVLCCGCILPFDVLGNLAVGWIWYLGRAVPQVPVEWDGVLTAVVCLALLCGGLHLFCRWLYEAAPAAAAAEQTPRRPWPFRWTAAVVGVVVLMFVAGVAVVGLTHQTAWLITSPEPLLRDRHEAMNRLSSASHLRLIALALIQYHDARASFPPGSTFDRYGQGLHSWQTLILPYVEQEALYKRIRLTVPWDHPQNAAAIQRELWIYLQPAVAERRNPAGLPLSHYAANARLLGGDIPRTVKSITDGTSETFLAGEAAGHYKAWAQPGNWRDPALGINRTPHGFGSPDRKGANMVMADGSVRFVSSNVSPAVLKALSTPDGGESIPQESWDLDR
jgi:prepilin-type processing-associated H-X9-DG protein